MKKKLVLLLSIVLVVCNLLCACGKSEAVKDVEKQINTLTKSSTYKQIHSVYNKYNDLSHEEVEDVENASILWNYCNESGHFVLTEDMIDEIENKLDEEILWGGNMIEFSISYHMSIKSSIKEWSDWGEEKISSHKQLDKYTYCFYGTVKVTDEYGHMSTRDMELTYFAEYDEEKECGYTINSDLWVKNN